MITTLQTIILAIVEGLTEFLPVSSTGHMIIVQNILGIKSDDFVNAFLVIIQFGAILSVVVLYWKHFFRLDHTPVAPDATPLQRLLHKWGFYYTLIIAFIPALVIGGLLNKFIDKMLDSIWITPIMLFIGGIFMLFCDKLFNKGTIEGSPTHKKAFNIGLFQCLSMIPGTSRSMMTIVGGMAQGLTRKAAAEFSFFLAVPTMFAATCLKIFQLVWKLHKTGNTTMFMDNAWTLFLGSAIAFVVAMFAIKGFVAFLTKYGFRPFGVYRIIVGGFIIAWLLSGHTLAMG